MRFVSIALFLFFIQLSVGLFNAFNILDHSPEYQTDWVNSNETDLEQLKEEGYVRKLVNSVIDYLDFGDFIKAINDFVSLFFRAVFSVKFTLRQFGIDENSPIMFYIPKAVYMIYLVALIQLIGNRTLKGMR